MSSTIIQLSGERYFPIPGFPVAVANWSYPNALGSDAVDYTVIPHRHNFHELVIISGGSGTQIIDGNKYPVRCGDIFLISGRSAHFFLPGNAMSLHNILFYPDKLPLPIALLRKVRGYEMLFHTEPKLRSSRNFHFHVHLESKLCGKLELLVNELSGILKVRYNELTEVESVSLLIQIIVFICRHYNESPPLSGIVSQINEILALLERNFTHPYTIDELARIAGTSPRNFSRLFNRVTGRTPVNYLTDIRLRNAEHMLTSSSTPIAEVAYRCAFADSNYFSKKFAERYGIPPRRYRQLHGMNSAL